VFREPPMGGILHELRSKLQVCLYLSLLWQSGMDCRVKKSRARVLPSVSRIANWSGFCVKLSVNGSLGGINGKKLELSGNCSHPRVRVN